MTNGALMASFFGNGKPTVEEGLSSMLGAIAKEHRDDVGVLRDYFETIVKPRRDGLWPAFYKAGQALLANA
jgi:hypothetical protein